MVCTRSQQKHGSRTHPAREEGEISRNDKPAVKKRRASPPAKTSTDLGKSGITFMDLPPEIRLQIYGYFDDFSGRLIVFPTRDLAQNINKDAIKLLHLNQTIRYEVSKAYYSKQIFQIRGIWAMEGFLQRIGLGYSSIIRRLEFGSALIQSSTFLHSLLDVMSALPSLERLAIQNATSPWVKITPEIKTLMYNGLPHTRQCAYVGVGEHTKALLRAAPQLRNGKLYYLDCYYKPELQFVPQEVTYTNAKPGVKIRFFSIDSFSGMIVFSGYENIVRLPILGNSYMQGDKVVVDLTDE